MAALRQVTEPTVIVLVMGPPGAGKTTVATLLQERLQEWGYPVNRLDSDRFGRNVYDQMFERVRDSSVDWIVAGTFYKRAWRERFEQLEDVFTVYLQADLETCLERDRQRDNPIDEKAVHIICHEFEKPAPNLAIDTSNRTPAEVVVAIVSALERAGIVEKR